MAVPGYCDASAGHASPNGTWVAIQVNCEAGGYVQVLSVVSGEALTLGVEDAREGEFLDWAASGDELLLLMHGLTAHSVYLVNVITQKAERLNVPETVYDLTLSPDGQRMMYSTTQGLGFGSETWFAHFDGSNAQLIRAEPGYLVIFPRWSPNGDAVAFIRLPDSSIPFAVGELWLADQDGANSILLSSADAGHGYRPVWSSDSMRLAFVNRENPADYLADSAADHLISNVYVADLRASTITNVSRFAQAHVGQPIWSPDGRQIAFGVDGQDNAGLWQYDSAMQTLQQVAAGDLSGAPLWITVPDR
jgi:Tol biopolymer transport system component